LENQAYHYAYFKVLTIIKPAVVWSYNYANNMIMALNRACNDLNIYCVEYQHSVQSDYDYAYINWPATEKGHAFFFPKQFWVWRESDRKRIKKNFTPVRSDIDVVIGGNICISEFISRRQKRTYTSNKILLTLQGSWMPEFIENYILDNEQFHWYIRLHPRYPLEKAKLIAFSAKYPGKVEIKDANEKPIYELFDLVDYHLTSFSGSALEAQVFGVQNIIYGQVGYDTYKEYIEAKAFFFVNNSGTLHNILNNRKMNLQTYDPILIDPNLIKENILNLLLHAKKNRNSIKQGIF